ncbi:hypothetical protein [Marinicrinis lubricantis]|uniref:Uncharacterized protein n=1 Tax=Marinicrinis lubricantis TaxID=2086470 RepID=A0ABW1IQG6_9BACL
MYRGYAVEYCNLELRFDRRRIQDFIEELIKEDYSLYWNEIENQFSIVIRSGKKLIKLKFERTMDRYKMVGNYSIQDERLAQLLEKLIGETRGHAVIKRFKHKQVQIDSVLFGEVIRSVEISNQDSGVLTEQLAPMISADSVIHAWKNKRAEERIPVLRMEIDYELALLHEAMQLWDQAAMKQSKDRLKQLRLEMMKLEM